jgi:hypothetical protein
MQNVSPCRDHPRNGPSPMQQSHRFHHNHLIVEQSRGQRDATSRDNVPTACSSQPPDSPAGHPA